MGAPSNFINVAEFHGKDRTLRAIRGLPPVHHRFDEESLNAINAALAAERPLLVRGEPGTGKSQLARAAAEILGRAFIWRVADAQTQVSDLFYTFDAISRLARAQVVGPLLAGAKDPLDVPALLDERNFVAPGPLWWAFAPKKARRWYERYRLHCEASAPKAQGDVAGEDEDEDRSVAPYSEDELAAGAVVLIDEIDKTDASVPNGLLEALGQGTFPVPRGGVISFHGSGPAPLVIITTNEERELPAAFLRRCLVLHIPVPEGQGDFVKWLVERGETHFGRGEHDDRAKDNPDYEILSREVLERVAELVFKDRREADAEGLSLPGQAEYLDFLRALARLRTKNADRLSFLHKIEDFALVKHPDLHKKRRGAASKGA